MKHDGPSIKVEIGMDALEEALVPWMNVNNTASYLGYSRQHVYTLLNAGKLAGIRTQAGWLVHPDAAKSYPERSGV